LNNGTHGREFLSVNIEGQPIVDWAKVISKPMKTLLAGMAGALVLSFTTPANPENMNTAASFHDFKVRDIQGKTFDFATLKGKRVLIVNTASECGYTPQYKQLEELYKTYGGEKFTVIGFPANNFGGQEPGSDAEIKTFCSQNYGVTFPMMSKSSVKGSDINPVYAWLTRKEANGVMDADVKWNFHKFLVDENGNVIKSLNSGVSPLSEEVIAFAKGK
jgi:glutathione peroxidase